MSMFKKVLVIQTAFPGDTILTLPLIQYLKTRNYADEIDVLCIPATEEVFKDSPSVNNVIVIDKINKHKNIFALLKFIKILKTNKYDAVYSPHRSMRSAIITLLLGAKETIGFDNSSLCYAYKNLVHYNIKDHEVKRNLSLTGDNFENDKWKIYPEINFEDEIIKKTDDFIKENSLEEKFIAIAPASVWGTKQYPTDQFKEVIELLSLEGNKILLIGSENDTELCSELEINSNVINSAGKFSIIESAALLKNSKLLISNDSLPAHLGMCVDIPVLMLYCSTVPEFGFYPFNDKSEILSYDDLGCKPCGIHGYQNCPLGTFECAKKLKPELVFEKAKEMLSQ